MHIQKMCCTNKNWLDLGCGSGKLIKIIKNYNPKNYTGIDIDIKQLLKAVNNNDNYIFNTCDLSLENWNDYPIKWRTINKIKYDYIVANFSLMHFFNDNFFRQLNELVLTGSKFLFNMVSNLNKEWSKEWTNKNLDSYLKIEESKTKYKFSWTHDYEKEENFYTKEEIESMITKHNWKIISYYSTEIKSENNLPDFYSWYIIEKM